MRRIGMLLLILLLLCGCAYAQEPEPETEVVTDGCPTRRGSCCRRRMPGRSTSGTGAKQCSRGALRAFGGWHEALRLCALLLAVLTFCALLQWQKGAACGARCGRRTGHHGATVASMQSMVQLAAGTIEELSAYGTCMLPVLASATAMSGGVSSSTALYGGAVLFSAADARDLEAADPGRLAVSGRGDGRGRARQSDAHGAAQADRLADLKGTAAVRRPVSGLSVHHRRHHRVGRRLGGQNDEGGGLRHGAGRRRHDLRCVGDAAGKCGCVEKIPWACSGCWPFWQSH